MRFVACMLVLAGCANLPELERSTCGNAIVESGEDCDRFEFDPSAHCRTPEQTGACHYDCSINAGTQWACPPGWACTAESLCRRPTGGFDPAVRHAVGGVDSLAVGDFDGDKRQDLLSRNPSDLAGRSSLSFHYFDARGALEDTQPFRKLVTAPAIGSLSDDGRADIVFSDFRVGVLLGRADRSWVPEAFTPYVLPHGVVRLTGMREGVVDGVSPLATVGDLGMVVGVYAANSATNVIEQRAPLTSPLDNLLGDPLGVDIVEGAGAPCRELVLAFRGESALQMFELCAPELPNGNVTWSVKASARTIALDPPAGLDAAPIAGDLNGDGHQDVLVGAGGIPYAAFGDGRGLATARPFQLALTADQERFLRFSMPLAVGDLSGDGVADFVLPDGIVLSQLPTGSQEPYYQVAILNSGGRWTTAKIADLNGNGLPDVIAAQRGRLHVSFFNGSGKPWLLESKVLSARPVSQIQAGDFDGDLIGDMVMVEQAASAAELDTVKVAFGVLSQPPGTPQTVARARAVQQVSSYREENATSMIIVADHPDPKDSRTLAYLLGGNAERIPFAALELLSFLKTGMIGNVAAAQLVLGAFAGAAAKDALALGVDRVDGAWQFWLVPAMDSPLPSPVPLGGARLNPRLAPSADEGRDILFPAARVYAVGAAADLDRDGRDESVWVMPADGTHCGIETFRVQGMDLVSGGLTVLEPGCTDPQLSAFDADADGSLDLLLLTGSKGASDRKLFVLWNDGAGHFAAERSVMIGSDSPQAFTTLPGSVVYTTQQNVVQWRYAGERTFAAPTTLATGLRNGTGIAAADLDGDRVTDLAVADDGDIVVLHAKVE